MGDGADGIAAIVADELVGPVDDHLRGVHTVEVQIVGILGLPGRELVGGEAVVPAERVPIVHVLLKDKDVGVGNGLVFEQMRQECIGGWATGAAFGGEEFDDDRSAGRVGRRSGAQVGVRVVRGKDDTCVSLGYRAPGGVD